MVLTANTEDGINIMCTIEKKQLNTQFDVKTERLLDLLKNQIPYNERVSQRSGCSTCKNGTLGRVEQAILFPLLIISKYS